MKRKLFELVAFEKSLYGVVKDRVKRLRKSAKKARKKKKKKLPLEEARASLESIFELFATQLDTAAARELGENEARVDLEVDGEVLASDLSPRLLLRIRKNLKRLRKAARELERLHEDPEISALRARTERLLEAIDEAVETANQIEVDERVISEAIVAYLRTPTSSTS